MNRNEGQKDQNAKFDALLTAALERQPEIVIPADFAARIASSLPARRTVRTTHYGRSIATICMVLLIAALVWIPIAAPTSMLSLRSVPFALEMLFTAELLALFFWKESPFLRD